MMGRPIKMSCKDTHKEGIGIVGVRFLFASFVQGDKKDLSECNIYVRGGVRELKMVGGREIGGH